ncbi:hypothetical protein [Sinorhizobium meliloti]|uniref:hypothetical protein n=1 Tax=Rhizobium meliloti TaxID=382 RepID=UPI000FDB95B9|nr:hypothetical protein [Sinorhizobium meliloti]
MIEHTPGPWIPTLCDDGAWMVNTDGDIIVVGDNLSETDARLIAAAPDLLAALKMMVELYNYANVNAFSNGVTDPTGSIDEGDVIASQIASYARAAIEKAEGRQ